MKVSVAQSALLRALDYVGVAVGKASTIPILGNVRLCVADGALTVDATDLEIMARASVAADVSVSGATTISLRRLRDYVAKLDGDSVDVTVSPEHWVTVASGRARARIAGCSPDAFPDAPGGDLTLLFTVDSATFARMIKQVQFAISREQSRFTIGGARLEVDTDQSQIEMVATDGHRLAHARSKVAGSSGAAPWTISSQALAALLKLVDVSGGDELSVSETSTGHMVFESAGQCLFVRLLSGHFPEWRKVLPSEFDGVAVFDRLSFAKAVERVVIFADGRSARVDLHVGDGAITVIGATPDNGEGHETVEAEVSSAECLDIAISGRYILDALKCSAAERMQLRFTDANRAIEVSPFGDAAHRTVIMPMRA